MRISPGLFMTTWKRSSDSASRLTPRNSKRCWSQAVRQRCCARLQNPQGISPLTSISPPKKSLRRQKPCNVLALHGLFPFPSRITTPLSDGLCWSPFFASPVFCNRRAGGERGIDRGAVGRQAVQGRSPRRPMPPCRPGSDAVPRTMALTDGRG